MHVIVQKWEEIEPGWGSRPEGFSLHLTEADRVAFVENMRIKQAKFTDYEIPDGTPYQATIDAETFERLEASDNGIYINDRSKLPGDGGSDGWRPYRPTTEVQ